MKLSRYTKIIDINDDCYAVYNNIYFDIKYVDRHYLKRIINYQVDLDEKNDLLNKYIYVSDDDIDNYLYKILLENFEKKSNLKTLYVIPSATCNMKCDYCFVYKNNYINNDDYKMDREMSDILIDRIFEYININSEEFILIFYGGEPLTNKREFFYIVKTLREKGFTYKISMITNGTLLDQKTVKFLSENNVSIVISVDGPVGVNERKQHSGSVYNGVLEKIPLLNENKIDYGLSLTITNKVLKKQKEVISWNIRRDVKSINYNMLHFRDDNYNLDYIKKYYKDVTNFIISSYINSSNIYEDRINRKLESFYNNNFNYADCSAMAGEQLTVSYNGDVSICNCDFNDKSSYIGNIKENNFENLLQIENTELNIKRNSPIYNGTCIECYALPICGGGCYKQYSDRHIDEGFCIHSKLLMDYLLKAII
ncbi:radical SAM/SPASM domain-containing protein [Anaerococcus sp. Marseille-P9784]|uniref:radical SAM/SPASM domain-containing protein n=1 Tax=Anaerococcus sp. Marseille-P9784 TaxID=2614127 RepID=UPI001249CC7A|nr:radical SAM protein [Anaerococcus sp. Marseille-P9784]